MTNDKICTDSDLKEFAWRSEQTPFNFARWIESKTNDKYTIVEKEFIRDALQALESISDFSDGLNESLKKQWKDAISMLKL